MNFFAAIFLIAAIIALLTVPRRWAMAPILAGACYMTNAQSLDIGPFHFTVLRTLILVGLIRSRGRGERLPGGMIGMDKVILLWGGWLITSSLFHQPFLDALVFRLGVFYNVLGVYFLIRLFCQTKEDVLQVIKIAGLLLIPVGIAMVTEKATGHNPFGLFGGVPEEVLMRDGKLRAQGPFGHPILAGTVGAIVAPLMAGVWLHARKLARLAIIACIAMVLASASSGPIMTLGFGVTALLFWRWRRFTRWVRIGIVAGYIGLNMVMSQPAYYVLASIDLTGGSTGYHRAALIDSAIRHLSEWWSTGTDYTRHWMPFGISDTQCDITNHYLYYGVMGGLPLMALFICLVTLGFKYQGRTLALHADAPFEERFLLWSLGACLFAHTATMISVAYFDQSAMFLYLNLAVLASMYAVTLTAARENSETAKDPVGPDPTSDPGVTPEPISESTTAYC